MKKARNFKELLDKRADLPNVGWIFVDKGVDKTSPGSIEAAGFYISENDDDDFFGEENLDTFLESPTFLDILEVREKSISKPSVEQYIEAVLHYLEFDDFLE